MKREQWKAKDIEAALRASGGIFTAAAQILEEHTGRGCAPNTIKNYVKRYKSLQAVLVEITDVHLDMAESKLLKKIRDEDLNAIMFFLRTKGRERGFVFQQHATLSAPNGGPVQAEVSVRPDLSKLTMEQLLALEAMADATRPDEASS